MDPWPLKPTHHEIWTELIGSSNLHNKIKANMSRQIAVLPQLHIIIALANQVLLHCLVDATVIHQSINPYLHTSPPSAKTNMI